MDSRPADTAGAEQYLEEKYGEDFELYSSVSVSIDVPYEEIFFRSASHPDRIAKVFHQSGHFSDNYYGTLVRGQFQALLDDAVSANLPGAVGGFSFRAAAFDSSLTDPDGFSAALTEFPDSLKANMFVFQEEEPLAGSAAYEGIVSSLSEKNVRGGLAVYTVPAEDLRTITSENYSQYLAGHPYIEQVFIRSIS